MSRIHYQSLMYEMPDGTLKMTNPLTGRTAWWVPGRSGRPNLQSVPSSLDHEVLHEPEDYCPFCPARLLETPPEIERRVLDGNVYRSLSRLAPKQLKESRFVFRRVMNLYEIVTLEYWRRNYDYRGPSQDREWLEAYKNDPEGREHLLNLVRMKHKALHEAGEETQSSSEQTLLKEAEPFFLGCHQLIMASRHYQPNASSGKVYHLQGSGALSADEHYEYFRFTSSSIKAVYERNRYVRYVVTFQNWLRPSGASIDHLHKQLVGLDDWGTSLSMEASAARSDPNFYNSQIVNFAGFNNLIIAESDHAVLFAGFGHRYPTLAIYSKSKNLRPYEHTPEELRGISNLVHACHAAQGPAISCNEEWYYQPRDCLDRIPFHVFIKWRVSNPAGFEGGTNIFINPLRPKDVRDSVVPNLYRLRAEGKIDANIRIAEECPVEPNTLRYNQ